MTSPKKNIDVQKSSTMFGTLQSIEKQTKTTIENVLKDVETIKRIQKQFIQLKKQQKISINQSSTKTNQQIKFFQQRIKNYLIAQKAQYMRFATQIDQMIKNSKQINAQLTILGNRFDDFQKNVGI